MLHVVLLCFIVLTSHGVVSGSIQGEIEDLKSIVAAQGAELAQQKQLINQLQERKQDVIPAVAFMATIAEWSTNYTDDDVVVFNEVIFDTPSGALDPSRGVYTAPVSGVYLFYTKVGAFINGDSPSDDNPVGNSYNCEIIIQVDGVGIANSNAFDGRDYLRNTQLTYPLQLDAGQKVSIQVRSTQRGDEGYITVQGIQANNLKTISWFGGHLIL